MNSYRSKATGEALGFSSRGILTAAVLSFLKFWVDDNLHYDWKLEPSVEEVNRQATRRAMSREDVQALYGAAQSVRDKTLVLLAAYGLSPAEMIQLTSNWKTWFPKDPQKLQAPYRISLVRHKPKNHFAYHVTLWQDACEALRTLHSERVRETGGNVDLLFASEDGTPLSRNGCLYHSKLCKHKSLR